MLKRWWLSHGRSLKHVVVLAGSVASITALFMNFLPNIEDLPWWGVLLLLTATILICLYFIFAFLDRPRRRVFGKGDNVAILMYLHNWIQHGGRVAIWTRDMSWANNEKSRQLLM